MAATRAPLRRHAPGSLEPEQTFWGRAGLRCAICSEPVDFLTKTHLRVKHAMTKAEYIKQFPVHENPAYWP